MLSLNYISCLNELKKKKNKKKKKKKKKKKLIKKKYKRINFISIF